MKSSGFVVGWVTPEHIMMRSFDYACCARSAQDDKSASLDKLGMTR